ncbi:pyridoxal phosphate-dependent aminotransferase [Pararhodonellum marinum]|uniref:pyridoxal phosphate-dependent aminotransferase n=1 Tax=Pararhodonellum marinum TaxID=2755358 RepID=UPI00188E85C5|nr:aminotransferase class I/II-fold pyridoxal phosphate-dependent enzyme [Pararhodonellum marinum]
MKGYSNRVSQVTEYYFSAKLREVNRLIAEGRPIINMGIGSPDLPPHPSVIHALAHSAELENSHGYQGYQGIPALRQAMAEFYLRSYRVDLDPEKEILPLMGSKEGIMHLSMAFLNEGDQALVPDPGYPTYTSVTKLLGAEAVPYVLTQENNWYPDLDLLEQSDLSKVKLMWVNYPHMPSGARANLALYEQLVAFGKKHDILIAHDNPYSFILEEKPKSIFEVHGASEVALELNSLSKTANMAGWRVGMISGKPEWIQAITKVKSNMDSGMFLGIQKGAIAALGLGSEWFLQLNAQYSKRRDLVWQLAEKLGLGYEKDRAGMFVWAKIPKGMNSEVFVDQLLYKKDLFVTPGHVFGPSGEGYVRFSLCLPEQTIQQAIDRI